MFAGLYDCVKLEGKKVYYLTFLLHYIYSNLYFVLFVITDEETPLYTYTIITTTSASTSIEFLHDRMPVILDNDSKELATWLDPRTPWCPELARLLKPFTGGLEL